MVKLTIEDCLKLMDSHGNLNFVTIYNKLIDLNPIIQNSLNCPKIINY